jgi:hypothetical protein
MGSVSIVPLLDEWANRQLLICAFDFTALSRHAQLFVDEIVREAKEDK